MACNAGDAVTQFREKARLVQAKQVASIEIHSRFLKLYDSDVMRAHYIRNWCREIKKFRTDIGQPRISWTDVGIAAAGELIFGLLKRRFEGC